LPVGYPKKIPQSGKFSHRCKSDHPTFDWLIKALSVFSPPTPTQVKIFGNIGKRHHCYKDGHRTIEPPGKRYPNKGNGWANRHLAPQDIELIKQAEDTNLSIVTSG
jgi:hypothetical protein